MKLIRVKLAPTYKKYIPSRLDINDTVTYYHDDDYRIMQQLDMVIQTDSELLIELLSHELNYSYGNNTSGECIMYDTWSLYRDELEILNNIFCDVGNSATDKSSYCNPDVYEKYKSILVEWESSDIKPFNVPLNKIDESDIDLEFRVDNMVTKIYRDESECTSLEVSESIGSLNHKSFFNNMNSL